MYRLLATDIDDTLLAPDGSLPETNRVALRTLAQRGVGVVFCSGRADISIQRIAASMLDLTDEMYLVSFNGARVVTAASRRVLTRDYVRPASIRQVADYSRRHELYLQGYVDDDFLAEQETPVTHRYAEATGTGFRIVRNMADELPEGSPKLLIIGDREALEFHRDRLAEQDPDITAMFSKPTYLEIVGHGVDKGSALAGLCGTLGVPVDAVVAVGDASNDVTMLRTAGLGLAVANAHESARAAADVVLESRAEDGVVTEIARRYFGIDVSTC